MKENEGYIIKCPNCGSTAQVKFISEEHIYGDLYYGKFQCGCGCIIHNYPDNTTFGFLENTSVRSVGMEPTINPESLLSKVKDILDSPKKEVLLVNPDLKKYIEQFYPSMLNGLYLIGHEAVPPTSAYVVNDSNLREAIITGQTPIKITAERI